MELNEDFDRSVILSTQSEFYANGKYSDVKLRVGDEVFPSQRFILASISEYFDKMFSGGFKESVTNIDEPIVLGEIDASAFKEIINLLFTGNVHVSDSNIHTLLLTSDFLQLRTLYVEDQCFKYLQSNNSKPISNAFEILSFTYVTRRKRFVDFFTTHILEHLKHFSEDVTSAEIPFEVLMILLEDSENDEKNHPCYAKGNALLKLVIRWMNHSRKERSQYRRQLMMKMNSSNVSSDCALFLLNECENFIDKTVNRDENVELLANSKELYVPKDEIEFVTGTTFTFKIENFSQIKLNKNIRSPPYIIHNLQWTMTISCRQYPPKIDKYLRFAIHFDGDQESCDASVSYIIVSQKEDIEDLTISDEDNVLFTFTKGIVCGYDELAIWNDILEVENGYIKDDAVIFRARVSF